MLIDLVFEKILLSALISLFIVATIFLWLLEWQRSKGKKLDKEKLISLSTVPPNTILYFLIAPIWAVFYQWLSQYSIYTIDNFYIGLLLAITLCDFSYYCEHRAGHQIKLLWKLYHGTHHTGQEYNIPLAFRVNCLNQLVAPLFYAPWILLGIEPLILVATQLFVFHYQGWLHTELIGESKLIDFIFNSPANHRVHHSQKHSANFGGVFMHWDRLFGTYEPPGSSLQYGVSNRESDESFVGIYTDLWKNNK